MPPNTVCVTRPGKWGNPYKVGELDPISEKPWEPGSAARAFRNLVMQTAFVIWRKKMRAELGGKNLACFCPIGHACHADILLAVANSTEAELYDVYGPVWARVYEIGAVLSQ